MTNARKERMIRDVIGADPDVPFPERTIRNLAAVAFVLLVAVAVTPSGNNNVVTGSIIDARAASTVNDAPPASLAIDPKAAEGNVVDMTY